MLDLRGYLNIVRERTAGPIILGVVVWFAITAWSHRLAAAERMSLAMWKGSLATSPPERCPINPSRLRNKVIDSST